MLLADQLAEQLNSLRMYARIALDDPGLADECVSTAIEKLTAQFENGEITSSDNIGDRVYHLIEAEIIAKATDNGPRRAWRAIYLIFEAGLAPSDAARVLGMNAEEMQKILGAF